MILVRGSVFFMKACLHGQIMKITLSIQDIGGLNSLVVQWLDTYSPFTAWPGFNPWWQN